MDIPTGISFDPKHMVWKKSPDFISEDVSGWFSTVRDSTGFHKMKSHHSLEDPEIREEDKDMLRKLIKKNNKIYEELKKFSI